MNPLTNESLSLGISCFALELRDVIRSRVPIISFNEEGVHRSLG